MRGAAPVGIVSIATGIIGQFFTLGGVILDRKSRGDSAPGCPAERRSARF
jgi:hypothetical protein